MEHVIDATNKPLGRIATEAALYLQGKKEPNFVRHLVADTSVKIINAAKVAIRPKKMIARTHQRYSGHPGGLSFASSQEIITKKGYEELFRKTVHGMLPRNKLRSQMMKHLIITD